MSTIDRAWLRSLLPDSPIRKKIAWEIWGEEETLTRFKNSIAWKLLLETGSEIFSNIHLVGKPQVPPNEIWFVNSFGEVLDILRLK
jgi:hypothetical protein